MPETTDALEKYLASGVVKGIGPTIAKKIIERFGKDTVNVFKFEPKKLADIKGISSTGALEMAEEFNTKWNLWQIVGFLEKFGINASNSKKVYEALGNDAIEEIQKNPYVLVDITYGVDFFKIDKMAIDIGIDINSYQRIGAGIRYSLIVASYNGNTCVQKEKLYEFVKERLGVEEKYIDEVMINLRATDKVIVEEIDEVDWVFLAEFYKRIAQRIHMMLKTQNVKYIADFDSQLAKEESLLQMMLSEKQKEALLQVNNSNISVITGGPGTRKNNYYKSTYRYI